MPRPIPPARDVPTPALPLAVVGDVHVCVEEPDVLARFVTWLEGRVGLGGTLVLLGDIFEVWVNAMQQHDAVPARVLSALRALANAGTELVFMQGNRDLAFRGADDLALTLWPDPVRTKLGSRTVLLTHGDQLCTADYGYQRLRRMLHGPIGAFLQHGLPYRAQRWLGAGARGLSMRETGRKPRADMGIDYGEALRWMDRHDANTIVAGHVHTGVHHRHPDGREVLVLKDWQAGGSVITFDGERLVLEAI
ncbi:MAG: UDP-2,3-diacylglucosamine diphosphatase [Planctomycetota bacterium]|nr:UDP-2,3-diacylglucosamine diphosphatase [Planctomycetota bacterium]